MIKGRIIYIGGFELPDKNAAAHRVVNNGKVLRELGYDVVFLGIDKELMPNTPVTSTYKDVEGFDSWSIPYPKKKSEWIKYLTSIEAFIKVYEQYTNVEAVICYNYQSASFLKLMSFCKSNEFKVYADCTEWYGAQGENIFMKMIKGLDSFVRMRFIHKKIDGLIVISEYLNNYYAKNKDVIQIPPLVDLSEEKWTGMKVAEGEREKIKLIYSGSPGRNKDKLNVIVRSLYVCKEDIDYVYTIIGITKKDYLEQYPEDRIILEELSDNIQFVGRIPHQESLRYLREADYSIFIREDNLVSRAGFPTKLVESISSGTPVITNSTSNISDYLIKGKSGFLIDTESFEKMVEELRSILLKHNVDRKYTMKDHQHTFDYKKFVGQFSKIF